MSKPRVRGFTLIELLTVIAIIAILVGITAAVLPGVMERSRITKTETTLKQLHTALSGYQVDNGSLPPRYGYITEVDNDGNPTDFCRVPYTSLIGIYREFALYDEYWATNYDLNGNNVLEQMEFQPLAAKVGTRYTFDLDAPLYDGTNLGPQVTALMNNSEQPPYAYFPVNRAQADKVRAYCLAPTGDDDRKYARLTQGLVDLFATMTFPPPYYDDYVLISPGPAGSTAGVIPADDNLITGVYGYHAKALRTFYLATRDQNDNGRLDFDFRARTRAGETEYLLPDGTNGAGPLIYHGG